MGMMDMMYDGYDRYVMGIWWVYDGYVMDIWWVFDGYVMAMMMGITYSIYDHQV